MSERENFADIKLQGMRDRSMRSETELAREIQLTDWSTAGNLSNRSSGVQIPRDICTRFGRYLYSTRCSWIIMICSPKIFQASITVRLLQKITSNFLRWSQRKSFLLLIDLLRPLALKEIAFKAIYILSNQADVSHTLPRYEYVFPWGEWLCL